MRSADAVLATEQTSTLLVTWQNPDTRTYYRIGVLVHVVDADSYTFEYVRGVSEIEDFTPLVGLEDTDRVHTSSRLFPVFAERIMDHRRPGFEKWLEALHTDRYATPMEILARSNGKRGSDTLQLFGLPVTGGDGTTRDKFFVHGVRHLDGASARIDTIEQGQHLDVVDDSSNKVDSRALIVSSNGTKLGWVPGPLLGYVRAIRDSPGWRCSALEVNPESAGSHQRLLVEVQSSMPLDRTYLEQLLASPSI